MYMSTKGVILAPPYLSSEVHRLSTEVNCFPSNVVSFVLNKTIKNSKQIITVVGNFQHTDHYFFGHEFVLDKMKLVDVLL